MRKLGDEIRIDLGNYLKAYEGKGAFLVVAHKGPGWLRALHGKYARLEQEELQRLVKLRKEFAAEDFPALYAEGFLTPDHQDAVSALALESVAQAALRLEVPPEFGLPATPREAMEYLGIAPLLIKEIIAAQTLEPEQVF